jgi:hypothetical protein
VDTERELGAFAEQLRELRERVDALERTERSGQAAPRGEPETTTPGDDKEFWALHALKRWQAGHPATERGAVLFTGALTLPTGEPVEWQQAGGTASLLEADWSGAAPALAALSHPVRLELLRQVLTGARTTAALAEVESLGSTGQLHHHLRQLVSAGWLRQSGRGSYEMPPTRIVALLAILEAARP